MPEAVNPLIHPELNQPPGNPDGGSTPAAPAQAQPAEDKRWAGKYATPEELEVAKLASDREVQERLLPQLNASTQRVQQLEQMMTAMVGGQPGRQQRSALDELETLGLPKELMERALNDKVQQALAPLMRTIEAQRELEREIPDFPTAGPEISRWLQSNPGVQSDINGITDPKMQAKYAYMSWKASQPAERQSAASTGVERNGAAIPTATTPASRGVSDHTAVDDEFRGQIERLQAGAGNERDAWRAFMATAKARQGVDTINPDTRTGGQ